MLPYSTARKRTHGRRLEQSVGHVHFQFDSIEFLVCVHFFGHDAYLVKHSDVKSVGNTEVYLGD